MDSFQESFGSSIFVRTKRESGSGLSLVAIAAGNGITQKGSHLYILLSFGQGKKYGFSFLFRQKVYFRPQPVWLQGMVQEEAPYLSWREGWEQQRIKSYRCFQSLLLNFFASGCWSCTYSNVIRACKKRKYVQHWTFPLVRSIFRNILVRHLKLSMFLLGKNCMQTIKFVQTQQLDLSASNGLPPGNFTR